VQVSGVIGVTTAAGRALAQNKGVVGVSHCLQHALGLANDFPIWAAQSFGVVAPCNCAFLLFNAGNDSQSNMQNLPPFPWRFDKKIRDCDLSDTDPGSNCANAMFMEYNYPRWFGPWAAGIKFDP
jgi:hypothetical protein